MDLGIDVGTSEVKVVLLDDAQRVVGQAHSAVPISRPQPLWSEQNPHDWWAATVAALAQLRAAHPKEFGAVRGLGLSGHMHGATLLDAHDRVLRPAILWNDGRSHAQCAELERRAPRSREITGNIAMPGFTAPKLMWVEQHEPEVFRRTARVLLPKDFVRLQLTGEAVSDMSDSAGTLWLDVAKRAWSDVMLAATHLERSHMPRLVEGSEASGTVLPAVATELGLPAGVVVAGGAGDNAASAAGIGVAAPGTAFLSLGTSGVYFVANAAYSPNPARAVHAFCHAFPNTWHQMTVMLSAASALRWLRTLTHADSEAQLVAEAEALPTGTPVPLFLPYLSGERTPHNNPHASGVLFGLTHDHTRPTSHARYSKAWPSLSATASRLCWKVARRSTASRSSAVARAARPGRRCWPTRSAARSSAAAAPTWAQHSAQHGSVAWRARVKAWHRSAPCRR